MVVRPRSLFSCWLKAESHSQFLEKLYSLAHSAHLQSQQQHVESFTLPVLNHSSSIFKESPQVAKRKEESSGLCSSFPPLHISTSQVEPALFCFMICFICKWVSISFEQKLLWHQKNCLKTTGTLNAFFKLYQHTNSFNKIELIDI